MGTGLVLDGARVPLAGIDVVNFYDDPTLALRIGNDGRARRPGEKIAHVGLHSTRGVPGGRDQRPQVLHPGRGPVGDAAEANARYWRRAPSCAGAVLVVDYDGSVVCTADVARVVSYHAPAINSSAIGVEIVQGSDAGFYEAQMATVVALCELFAARFGLPRTVQWPYRGAGAAVATAVGHRDVDDNRGKGDPGDFPYQALVAAGWTPVDRGHK